MTHLHPVMARALQPWIPPTYEPRCLDELREKIEDEHRTGMDGGEDGSDD